MYKKFCVIIAVIVTLQCVITWGFDFNDYDSHWYYGKVDNTDVAISQLDPALWNYDDKLLNYEKLLCVIDNSDNYDPNESYVRWYNRMIEKAKSGDYVESEAAIYKCYTWARPYRLLTGYYNPPKYYTAKDITVSRTSIEYVTKTTTDAKTETTTVAKSSKGGGGSSVKKESTTETTTTETTTRTSVKSNRETTTEATTIGKHDTVKKHKKIKVSIGSDVINVDNSKHKMDAKPYIQPNSDSTLVPLRFVAIALQGEDTENADKSKLIVWNGDDKTATLNINGKIIVFTVGSEYMSINGIDKALGNNAKAEIKGGRMYIPFRALGEAMGVSVEWDAETKSAIYTIDV